MFKQIIFFTTKESIFPVEQDYQFNYIARIDLNERSTIQFGLFRWEPLVFHFAESHLVTLMTVNFH